MKISSVVLKKINNKKFSNSLIAKRFQAAGFTSGFLFLIIISITLGATSNVSYEIFNIIRDILLFIAVVLILLKLLCKSITSCQFLAIYIYLAALSWALMLSQLNDAINLVSVNIITDLIVVMLGILLIPMKKEQVFPDTMASIYLCYSLFVIIITIATNGFIFELPPRFSYEYSSARFGAELDYGQGHSFFFGLSSVIAAYAWKKAISIHLKALYLVIAILFLSLSILGGARGESIIAVFIVSAIFFIGAPKHAAIVFVVSISFLSIIEIDFNWINDLTLVLRVLEVTGGDYGMRDVLLAQAINLLSKEPLCAFIGCGPGYFQIAHGYDFSLYPHNIFIESMIIFGIPVIIFTFFLAANGAMIYYKKIGKKIDIFLLILFYNTAISMKSGYFFGSWFTLIGVLFFISINFENQSRK